MNGESQRLFFLDNTRVLMVLFIVLLHAACAYATFIPWWQVRDTTGQLFDLIIIVIDSFSLPTLFLIAGLFAPSSLQRRDPSAFFKAKLLRFGFPTVLLMLTFIPLMFYVGYKGDKGFGGFWLDWIASSADWSFLFLDSMESAVGHEYDMSPSHLWFIVMLLVFFGLYALVRHFRPHRKKPASGHTASLFFWLALSALGLGGLNMLMQDWAWCKWGPLFLFQPSRIPLYGAFFFAGASLGEKEWLKGSGFPGKWWIWLIGFLVSLFILLVIGSQVGTIPGALPPALALAHGCIRTVTGFTAAAFFCNLAFRSLNAPNRSRESLAASSYDIYLLHLPVCVFMQAALLETSLPPVLKMLTAFVVTIIVCWFLSRKILLHSGIWPAPMLSRH